ncbi:hypothetical protein L6452_14421 [Arctium lappa]|uniref:Uncharacterized protein n=1 Tax=Arctium lappa TaxID=4217 RepID=A0ACB9CKV3_ARCLA|nr:hypothetical protein L6452_14421 [Arctium lappa]
MTMDGSSSKKKRKPSRDAQEESMEIPMTKAERASSKKKKTTPSHATETAKGKQIEEGEKAEPRPRTRLSGEKRKNPESGKIADTTTSKQGRKRVTISDRSKGKAKARIMTDENSDNDFENPKVLKTES